MARIDAFLKLGTAQGCSDIHLAVGVPPMLRMHGDLMPIKFRDLGDAELESYVDEILTPRTRRTASGTGHDLDFSYVSDDGGRFRVNVFRKDTGVGATFRVHPERRADARHAEPAAGRQEALRLPPGHDAGHRLDRHRQVDDARGDDRPPEPHPQAEHHQPRGSDRVRPPQQAVPGRSSASSARTCPRFAEGVRAAHARGPGRDPGRRAARRRDRSAWR